MQPSNNTFPRGRSTLPHAMLRICADARDEVEPQESLCRVSTAHRGLPLVGGAHPTKNRASGGAEASAGRLGGDAVGGHHAGPPDGSAVRELLTHPAEPLVARNAVRAELLDPVLLLAGEERAVRAELAGVRGVEQVAGVGRAHLEEHPHLELAQDLVGEVAVQVVHACRTR